MPSTTLVRRREIADFEAGPRPMPPVSGPLALGRRPLLAASSYVCARTEDPVVGLTYDDGPDPVQTPAILDELAREGFKATFYVLTRQAEAHPDVLRRILDEGHEVGLHGIDHTRLTTVPMREAARRIGEGKRRLEDLTGRPVTSYRPCYGAQSPAMHRAARRAGMDVVIWTAWAQDWFDDDVAAVAGRAIGALHPGAVLLLHDCTDDTDPAELPRPRYGRGDLTRRVLDGMAERGLSGTTVADLTSRYPAVRSVWFEKLRH